MHNQASTDPVITEFFFVRHAPVIKEAGVLPAHDPNIVGKAYAIDEIATTLPQNANGHSSALQR